MKKIIIVISMMILLSVIAVATDYWGGYIFFNDGNVLEVEKFDRIYAKVEGSGRYHEFDEYPLYFRVTPEGIVREIGWDKIISITLNGDEWEEEEIINIQLRDERMWDVYLDWGYITWVEVDYYDEFSQELMKEKEFRMEDIKALVFSKDYGNMKINPETNQIYPHEYNFDPYTGIKLKYFIFRK